MRLGEILLKNGILEDYQLDYALQQQRYFNPNKPLGQLLIEFNLVDKETLINSLAEQQSAPGINILESEIQPEALFTLNSTQAYKYNVIPFRLADYRSGNMLYVATSEPNDFTRIEELSFVTGYPVKPFFAMASDIKTAITISYNSARKIS